MFTKAFSFLRRAGSIVALVAATALFSAPGANATPQSEAFVQDTIEKGYAILNNKSLSDADRRQQFKAFMESLTDIRRIAVFTLGRYANSATPAQIDEFVGAFSEYMVAVYETRLSKYQGQTMRVTGSDDTRGPDDSVVNAEVVNPAAPTAYRTRTAFRVRPGASGKPIITDMQVEGIWVAITQREDFTSYLQQNGGSVPALTNHLRAQARALWGSSAG
jgi:phospholipid transport system substrate-binding protein